MPCCSCLRRQKPGEKRRVENPFESADNPHFCILFYCWNSTCVGYSTFSHPNTPVVLLQEPEANLWKIMFFLSGFLMINPLRTPAPIEIIVQGAARQLGALFSCNMAFFVWFNPEVWFRIPFVSQFWHQILIVFRRKPSHLGGSIYRSMAAADDIPDTPEPTIKGSWQRRPMISMLSTADFSVQFGWLLTLLLEWIAEYGFNSSVSSWVLMMAHYTFLIINLQLFSVKIHIDSQTRYVFQVKSQMFVG